MSEGLDIVQNSQTVVFVLRWAPWTFVSTYHPIRTVCPRGNLCHADPSRYVDVEYIIWILGWNYGSPEICTSRNCSWRQASWLVYPAPVGRQVEKNIDITLKIVQVKKKNSLVHILLHAVWRSVLQPLVSNSSPEWLQFEKALLVLWPWS